MIIKLINVLAILNLFNYNIMANACMGTSSSSATTDVGTSTEDTASTTEDTTTTTWPCDYNEFWSDCICEGTCDNQNPVCHQPYGYYYSPGCKSGCQCSSGYVRSSKGRCIPVDHCIINTIIIHKPPPPGPPCGDKYCPPGHMCKNFCSKTYYYEKCEQKCVKESERISCEEVWCPEDQHCRLVCQDYNYYKFKCIPKCVSKTTTTSTTSTTSTTTSSTTSTTTTSTSTTTSTTTANPTTTTTTPATTTTTTTPTTTTTSTTTTTTTTPSPCVLDCPTLCLANGCQGGQCQNNGQFCVCNFCSATATTCDATTCTTTCTNINCPIGQCQGAATANNCQCQQCFGLRFFDVLYRRINSVFHQNQECTCPANTANIYIALGTPTILHEENRAPAASCTTCKPTGVQQCFNSGGMTGNPQDFSLAAGYGISIPFCERFCACTEDDICFIPVNEVESFRIAPFCNNGKCCNNIFFMSNDDDAGLMTEDGTEMFTTAGQRDPNTGSYLPFTCDGSVAYPEIISVGCGGCQQIRDAICTGIPV